MKNLVYLFIFLFLNCNKTSSNVEKDFTGLKYYNRCSRYNHPVKLIEELTEINVKNRRAYFIGYYERGLLKRIDKILDEKLTYSYIYEYDSLGNFIKFSIKKNE